MYGKINTEGDFELLEKKFVVIDGLVYANPDEATLFLAGYKPIVTGGYPFVSSDSHLYPHATDMGEYIYLVYKNKYGFEGDPPED